jgi:hypothetical protein
MLLDGGFSHCTLNKVVKLPSERQEHCYKVKWLGWRFIHCAMTYSFTSIWLDHCVCIILPMTLYIGILPLLLLVKQETLSTGRETTSRNETLSAAKKNTSRNA